MSDVPLWVWKAARRIMELCSHSPFVEVRLMRVDGVWYIQTGNKRAERLEE